MIQVSPQHYAPVNYDTLERWTTYWHQARAVLSLQPASMLEVGVGGGILTWYLRHRASLSVTTVDIDARLRPDVVADVLRLSQAVTCQYEVVTAFQVLEHLPFESFEPALCELAKVSAKHVLISLPWNGHVAKVRLRLWRLNLAWGRKFRLAPRAWTFDGEHHWEVGTKAVSRGQVRRALKMSFAIEREWACPDHPYHLFFLLTPRPGAV
jgi:hypothetical protein